MTPRRIIICLVCVLTAAQAIRARQNILPEPEPTDSNIVISLLTCAPGKDIYELEGHSGLRMQYGGYDITANWGLFDFDSPNFLYRFVKGETDYCVGAYPTMGFLYQYKRAGRRVTEQVLNLTDEQARRLIALVNENLYPENKVYRYNYVKDNCATRVLDIIERSLDSRIVLTSEYSSLDTNPTFRNEMRYFHNNYPWYQFGIDIALGPGIDYRISQRETMFAPVVMQRLAANAKIITDGNVRPLVIDTNIIINGVENGVALPATPWYLTPLAAMTELLVITLLLTWRNLIRHTRSRWFDALLFGVEGICGCVVAFLVFISVHEASSPNWVLLWLNPLCLSVPLLQWWKHTRPVTTVYHTLNIAATLLLTVLFIVGVQSPNPAFYPAMASALIRSCFILYTLKNHEQTKA